MFYWCLFRYLLTKICWMLYFDCFHGLFFTIQQWQSQELWSRSQQCSEQKSWIFWQNKIYRKVWVRHLRKHCLHFWDLKLSCQCCHFRWFLFEVSCSYYRNIEHGSAEQWKLIILRNLSESHNSESHQNDKYPTITLSCKYEFHSAYPASLECHCLEICHILNISNRPKKVD